MYLLFLCWIGLVLGADSAEVQTQHWLDSLHPQELLLQALKGIEHLGSWGVLAFIALYAVATVAFVPGSILTLGSGAIFGVVAGSIYVLIGANLGAIAAFAIGRYLARDWVFSKIADSSRFQAIDRAVGQNGFKIVLLTRLSPAFPFILLNYVYGLTRVSLKDYILGSVGMIPGTISYVYLGAVVSNLALLGTQTTVVNPWLPWGLRLLGLGATILGTVYLIQLARRALADSLLEGDDENAS